MTDTHPGEQHMTTLTPNPHSPYADADPTYRHMIPSFFLCAPPKPGVLALTGCERMAVVPEEGLRAAGVGPRPDGLCPACLAAMRGEELPLDVRPTANCRECHALTAHDGLCAVCRQEAHETWWLTRDTAAAAAPGPDAGEVL